jgi:16S rRNA (uracil1498-N3)-methyltransferase
VSERFFVEQPLSVGPVSLDGPEAHHLATVCRLRPGDAVTLFNGDGREYAAHVVSVGKRAVELEIVAETEPAREVGFRLEVAAPLPKGDRADFLLEKLTELGATAFTPLRTARSVVHPHEAKLERLQRHIIEASKQCGRNVLLRVGPLTDWSAFVGGDLPARRLVAHPGGEALSAAGGGGDVALAVGPEGGLTDEEVEQARAAGWRVVGLGPRVLRVETAALTLTAWAALAAASEG